MKPDALTAVLFLIATAILFSCDSADYRSYQKNYYANPAAVFAKFDQPSSQTIQNPAHGRPGHRCDVPVGAPLPSANLPSSPSSGTPAIPSQPIMTTSSTTAALNPPHGKPGHRCDIPAGAPLNSTPVASKNNRSSGLSNGPLPPSQLNPAHGQPGHRCDIAVGAPLNSAPVTKNQAARTSTTATKTSSGLNPPHGQPGHRCNIAVGAPLNSATALKTDTIRAASVENLPFKPDSLQTTLSSGNDNPTVRLNPPHGQPGHDCSIPVGKPLKQ